MTTKTGITDTLAFDYQFTNNWGPSDAIDPQGQGYAAWFPRSYIISYDGFNAFSQDFVYMEAEIVLKKFLLDVKKCSDKQNIFKANKQRLIICCNIIRKKSKPWDKIIESRKGIRDQHSFPGKIKPEEKSFLAKTDKQLTPAYQKFIKKETWFQKAKKHFPEFKCNKSLTKQEQHENTI